MGIGKEYSKEISVKCFERHFFTSVEGYNKLCYNIDFYSAFRNYDYMLIYQLDAWVFRNELQMWCEKGYDYIGSPFLRIYLLKEQILCIAKRWWLLVMVDFLYVEYSIA